ncbi:glycine--tRNA ligase subunit beta [Campylobacter sp. MIT 99-7217]|uniref:glycine--tRNA ligase subunit beta n=1 Tax=Campylobacter sp. MIT 99-7217 TaxID=535091 RepID=UPI0011584EA0|nr:glycine--tRNA ligase subunit beta [Campylobacter sp. MIT 99-7217]TQR32979.1 glycine--tRNA ligase subunit beta [Campylobacter sp. MIT 99-7217]
MQNTLLIEIGVEELPALPLLKELKHIKPKWKELLEKYHLQSEFEFFYTPRRLVLFHENFKEKQEDSMVEHIGAPKEIAFKDGKLSPAAKSFLQKAGITENELQFKEIKGKEVLYHQSKIQGLKSSEVLPKMIEEWLQSLNFGKTMRWGNGEFEFIRAIRSIVCILGEDLVEFSAYGVKSAKKTFVHRSVSYEALEFKIASEYFELLEKNFVILDPQKRRAKILDDFKQLCSKNSLIIGDDEELLDEVVAITEYPNALLGSFEKEFLEIPSEVIITSMRENQRYFAVFNEQKLSNHFVVVSNAICKDNTQIIAGNERVLRARLSDAMFFYQNDLKEKLNPSKISKMQYLDGLGTMRDKVDREKQIATLLCKIYQINCIDDILTALEYAKADLCTQMVYEFTNLQGIMGAYYAKAEGFKDEICLAIKEQYLPNSDKSALPSSQFSSIVALATKLDTLLGLFSIGKIPSGTKDPYALRRAANGVIKIILNLGIHFDLKALLDESSKLYKKFDTQILLDFILERLYPLYEVNASFVKSALFSKNYDLIFLDDSIKALIKLSKKADFMQDFATFKRLANIASITHDKVDEKLFVQDEEKALFKAFMQCDLNAKAFDLLQGLFALKPQIDSFFDKVMINDKDEKLKKNRQALIFQIYQAFLKVADIKELSL